MALTAHRAFPGSHSSFTSTEGSAISSPFFHGEIWILWTSFQMWLRTFLYSMLCYGIFLSHPYPSPDRQASMKTGLFSFSPYCSVFHKHLIKEECSNQNSGLVLVQVSMCPMSQGIRLFDHETSNVQKCLPCVPGGSFLITGWTMYQHTLEIAKPLPRE